MKLQFEQIRPRAHESFYASRGVSSQFECPYHFHPELELRQSLGKSILSVIYWIEWKANLDQYSVSDHKLDNILQNIYNSVLLVDLDNILPKYFPVETLC